MYRVEGHTEKGATEATTFLTESRAYVSVLVHALEQQGCRVVVLERRPGDSEVWRPVSTTSFEVSPPPREPASPKNLLDEFIVCMRGDRTARGDRLGGYELATPHVFLTEGLAAEFAEQVDPGRHPIVVRGLFSGLRFD